MRLIFDSRWCGPHGIGKFASRIKEQLGGEDIKLGGRPTDPLDPLKLALRYGYKPHSAFISPGYTGPLFGNAPYILAVHDLNHVDRPENSSVVKRIYYDTILRRIVNRSSGILTVSNFSKNRIIEYFGIEGSKVHVVGNGVDEIFFSRNKDNFFEDSRRYILMVSNRKGHKNEIRSLDAFSKAQIPVDIHLVMTGVVNEELKSKISELGLNNRVFFSGIVSDEQLAALYAGADALLFPSLYEGFGLPIIEAFASGVPVVTSNVSSMPEISGDCALLVDPFDVKSIAEAIEVIYNEPKRVEGLVIKGLARAKEFSWALVIERVKCAIGSVLGGK